MKILRTLFITIGMVAVGQESKTKFEVAAIKTAEPINAGNAANVGMFVTPGLVRIVGAPLAILIQRAYGVGPSQVSGPDFLIFDRFDVMAKIPPGVGSDKVPEMLQELLRERFDFRMHEETSLVRGYALTVENPKLLEKSKIASRNLAQQTETLGFAAQRGDGPRATYTAVSLSKFAASFLTNSLGVPVADKTNDVGRYTLWVQYSELDPDVHETTPGRRPTFAEVNNSLENQGLKLLPTDSVPRRRIFVDHVNKNPTEN